MTYPYDCPNCGYKADIVKYAKDSAIDEPCPKCGSIMNRVWTVPQAIIENSESYFNYGLGCVVNNKRDVKEAVKRLGGEQVRYVAHRDPETGERFVEKKVHAGIEVEEIGNEKEAATKLKPREKAYEVPREVINRMAE